MMSVAAFTNRRWIGVNGASAAEVLDIGVRLCFLETLLRFCGIVKRAVVVHAASSASRARHRRGVAGRKSGTGPLTYRLRMPGCNSCAFLENAANVVEARNEGA